mgnify:FL=1
MPFMVVSHFQTDWFGKEADKSIEYLLKHNIPHKALRDGQVIVVDGNKEEFLE